MCWSSGRRCPVLAAATAAAGVEAPTPLCFSAPFAQVITSGGFSNLKCVSSRLFECSRASTHNTISNPNPNHGRATSGAEGARKVDRAPWKWAVRQRIWELLEKRDLAAPPRPVYHRM